MATLVYLLCAFTSGLCGTLIYRRYRSQPSKFLFWMMVGFVGLFISQFLMVIDLVVLPVDIDLSVLRSAVTLISLSVMVYGFVWEAE